MRAERYLHLREQYALVKCVGADRDRTLGYHGAPEAAPRFEKALTEHEEIVFPLDLVFVVVSVKRRACKGVDAHIHKALRRVHPPEVHAPLKGLVLDALKPLGERSLLDVPAVAERAFAYHAHPLGHFEVEVVSVVFFKAAA